MWSAQFGRKLVLGTRSKWPRPRRDRVLDNFSREETETRRWYVSRPRPQLWFQRTAIATFSSYYLIILLVYCRKQKQEKSLSLLTTSDFGAFDILSCTNGHTALHYRLVHRPIATVIQQQFIRLLLSVSILPVYFQGLLQLLPLHSLITVPGTKFRCSVSV